MPKAIVRFRIKTVVECDLTTLHVVPLVHLDCGHVRKLKFNPKGLPLQKIVGWYHDCDICSDEYNKTRMGI